MPTLSFAVISVGAVGAAVCGTVLAEKAARNHLAIQRSLLFGIGVTLMILGLVPMIFPYDHVGGHDAGETQSERAAHTRHCHGARASCSDAPLSAGPGKFIFNEPLLPDPPLSEFLVGEHGQLYAPSVMASRDTPPPRA